MKTKFILAGLIVVASCAMASAQQAQTVRLSGTIAKVEGTSMMLKLSSGEDAKLSLAPNAQIVAVVKASMADIKDNTFLGSAAIPQPDGSQKALEVHIFPEAMRGTGEGHRPYAPVPNSTMTNGSAAGATVTGVDGSTITVKYKDGEKKLLVTPQTVVVTYEMGKREEIQPGTRIFIGAAKKQADGTLQTPRITYGRNGEGPAF